jgi:hypothetical protein
MRSPPLRARGSRGCVPAGKTPFAYVDVFRSHTNVGFFYGAHLDDPAGLLEGTGKNMRHVKLRPGHAPDSVILENLIDASYLDIKMRLRAE